MPKAARRCVLGHRPRSHEPYAAQPPGAVLAAADNGCNDDSCVALAGSSGDMAPVAIAGLGVGGAVIGGIIGSFWKREAWSALPRARWYIGTGGHGAGTLDVNLSM